MTPDMLDALRNVGQPLVFRDGEALRQKGTFAPDMLLITTGQVDCILSEADDVHLKISAGTIVGEIGFLTGQAATATLLALGPVEALSLDARALQRLQQETPAVASNVLRHLASLLQERSVENQGLIARSDDHEPRAIRVIRCSTLDQRRTAQRVHYDVHCLENGLDAALADHEEGIIADDPDHVGTTFIAFTGVQAIGMMRVHSGKACGADLACLHGAFLTEPSVVITASAVLEAHLSEEILGEFLNAIKTFAVASGADTLLAHCPRTQEALFAAQGFVRTGNHKSLQEIGPMLSMILQPIADA